MNDLIISLPNWSPARIVRESLLEFRRLHPGQEFERTRTAVVGAVCSWIRHRFSNYDQLATDQNRDQLQAEVAKAVFRQWPWLRPDGLEFSWSNSKNNNFLEAHLDKPYFDMLSACLADLYSEKSRILMAIGKTRDSERADLRTELREIQEAIDQLSSKFAVLHDDGDSPEFQGVHVLTNSRHVPGEYNLGGLPTYRTRSVGFKCWKCGMTVLRSNGPVAFGAGVKLTLVSCHCHSIATTLRKGALRFVPSAERWQASIDELKQSQQPEEAN